MQEGWGQECGCLDLGRGNIIWDEPTMGIPVSWAPIALCQASLCLNVCSPQKEAFGVEQVTFRPPDLSKPHISMAGSY